MVLRAFGRFFFFFCLFFSSWRPSWPPRSSAKGLWGPLGSSPASPECDFEFLTNPFQPFRRFFYVYQKLVEAFWDLFAGSSVRFWGSNRSLPALNKIKPDIGHWFLVIIGHSSLVPRHSSPVISHESLVARDSSLATRHSSRLTRNPILLARHSSLITLH